MPPYICAQGNQALERENEMTSSSPTPRSGLRHELLSAVRDTPLKDGWYKMDLDLEERDYLIALLSAPSEKTTLAAQGGNGTLATDAAVAPVAAAPSATLPQRLREQGYADVPHPVLGSAPCDKNDRTPRTDEQLNGGKLLHPNCVHADFARQLERELAMAKACHQECETDAGHSTPCIYDKSAPSAIAPPADPEHDALVKDAARYRWLLKYLVVEADSPEDWTCWLGLTCIPYRSKTSDPQELLDAMMARFPLAATDGGGA